MFSANENILLREHKKRIVKYVEETIPEEIQDMGTMVMVMQLTCQAPGCVPLETAVIVIFPPSPHELLPGLPQSKSGGMDDDNDTTTASSSSSSNNNNGSNFQTKILKPMAEVTREDVLDALPPAFTGGRRTMEALCVRARDVMLAQITQIMGNDDKDGRQLMAEYLTDCLQEYLRRDCTPPEYGQPYPPILQEEEKQEEQLDATAATSTPTIPASSDSTTTTQENNKNKMVVTTIPGTSNLVIRRVLDNKHTDNNNNNKTAAAAAEAPQAPAISSLTNATSTTTTTTNSTHLPTTSTLSKPTTTTTATATTPSQMDWRNRQRQQYLFSSNTGGSIVARLSEREHAPGVRRPGCPCCDPDNISNILDKMMSM